MPVRCSLLHTGTTCIIFSIYETTSKKKDRAKDKDILAQTVSLQHHMQCYWFSVSLTVFLWPTRDIAGSRVWAKLLLRSLTFQITLPCFATSRAHDYRLCFQISCGAEPKQFPANNTLYIKTQRLFSRQTVSTYWSFFRSVVILHVNIWVRSCWLSPYYWRNSQSTEKWLPYEMLDCVVFVLQPHADKSIDNIKFKYEIRKVLTGQILEDCC